MTGDPENEGAGELPPAELAAEQAGEAGGESPSASPTGDPVLRRKAFANWGAAKREPEPEAGPSLWKRTSQRLKSMLGGGQSQSESQSQPQLEPETEAQPDFASDLPLLADHREEAAPAESESYSEPALELTAAAPSDEIELTPASEATRDASDGIAPIESVDLTPAPVDDPKEDLAFLRSGSFDAIDEPEAEAPPPKKPGLFGRLFSPKKSQPAVEPEVQALEALEAPLDEPAIDVTAADVTPVEAMAESQPADIASLDEALPMDEPAAPDEPALEPTVPLEVAVEEPPSPKKPGFFARMLGRAKAAEAKAAEVDVPMDLEPVADTAPETAGSLDAADSAFATASDDFAPPPSADAGFASVDDALPVEAAPIDDVPPAMEFTQPVDLSQTVGETPVGAEVSASYHSMPVYDFDTPKPDDRSTLEVDMPVADAIDARPTAELAPPEPAFDHADEDKRDTDEIELVDLGETVAEDPEKTAEVARGPGFFKKLFSRTKEVTMVEPAVAPPPTANPTFLVSKFRTFYNEVVIYKSQKADLTAGFATAIVTSYDADLSPEQAAQSLSQRLHQMLELQLAEASWMGGEAHDLYPEAQYAMACLADEMLTYIEWPGQPAWGAHHLELKLFKTAASDVEFFKRVDKLLKNGPQTVGTRDLARVYLLAIASGFRGKYRPFGLHRPLAEYRRRLYEFVYGGDALLLYADDRRIFPEAVSVTVAGKGVRRFSMAQQWAAILVLLLAGYTLVAHLAWTRVSADLKDIAGRVEQARTSTTNTADSPNGGGGR